MAQSLRLVLAWQPLQCTARMLYLCRWHLQCARSWLLQASGLQLTSKTSGQETWPEVLHCWSGCIPRPIASLKSKQAFLWKLLTRQ